MTISSRTPEGWTNDCPVCAAEVRIEPSQPFGDAPCPCCGSLLWFCADGEETLFRKAAPGVARSHLIARVMEGLGISHGEAIELLGGRGFVRDLIDVEGVPATPTGPGYVTDESVLSCSQIRERYPDRWVLVEKPVETGEPGFGGRVRFHSIDRDQVHRAARELCHTEVEYLFTGRIAGAIAL